MIVRDLADCGCGCNSGACTDTEVPMQYPDEDSNNTPQTPTIKSFVDDFPGGKLGLIAAGLLLFSMVRS